MDTKHQRHDACTLCSLWPVIPNAPLILLCMQTTDWIWQQHSISTLTIYEAVKVRIKFIVIKAVIIIFAENDNDSLYGAKGDNSLE